MKLQSFLTKMAHSCIKIFGSAYIFFIPLRPIDMLLLNLHSTRLHVALFEVLQQVAAIFERKNLNSLNLIDYKNSGHFGLCPDGLNCI